MTVKAADRRREASQEIHSAVESFLPRLKFREMDQFASDLTQLATRPQMLLKALSFARAMVDQSGGGDLVAPTLKLAGDGHGPLIKQEEGVRRLNAIAETAPPQTWAESDLLGPEAVVERLGVSRGTLHNWRRDGRVIALRKGLRNHVYPMRQFAGKAPLAGISEVLAVMVDPDEAWEWLVMPNRFTEGAPPLALLERGQVEAVQRAANSSLDFA